jgi:hypothetical protein
MNATDVKIHCDGLAQMAGALQGLIERLSVIESVSTQGVHQLNAFPNLDQLLQGKVLEQIDSCLHNLRIYR